MKILIADDDPLTVLRLRRVLEGLGHQAMTAVDGESAWRQIQECAPNVVISDWMMPAIDGLELCKRVRAQGGGAYTYFILLTGRETRDDRLLGLNAGADDFVAKPPDSAELVARLGVAERILNLHAELHEKAMAMQGLSEELARMNDCLKEQASTDPLTGVFNRRHFEASLDALLRHTERHNRTLSLAMADIDHFKEFNDKFGHPAGDEALCKVAATFSQGVRSLDLVTRFGGEEFAIVLPDAEGGMATQILERLRNAVAANTWPLRTVTISAGVTSRNRAQSAEQLLREADEALYRAKRAGRNCVVHYEGDDGLHLPPPDHNPLRALCGSHEPASSIS